MADENRQLHAIVSGRVQGVNFRYYTQLTAHRLGARGWVRNLDDGSVEVVAEGTAAQLDKLLAFLRKGPPSARVIDVSVQWYPASGHFEDFQIRY